jgi:integrase
MKGCILCGKCRKAKCDCHAGWWMLVVTRGYRKDAASGKLRQSQKWHRFEGTKREAQTRLRELLHDVDEGDYVERSTITLGEWLTRWLDKVVKPKARLRTYRTYKSIIEGQLLKADIGAIPLQKLQTMDLEAYYASRTRLAPASKRLQHAIIRTALRKAVKEKFVNRNVAREVDNLPKLPKHRDHVDANVWDAAEARRFLAVAKKAGGQTAAFFATALDSGARKSELAGLRWADLDFAKGKLKIEQQLVSLGEAPGFEPVWGPPKSGGTRVVDLDADTLALLAAHRRRQRTLMMRNRTTYANRDLIFAREHQHVTSSKHKLGDPLDLHNAGVGEFARLMKAAKVKTITMHGLRHSMATLMLAAGVPLKTVQERLGHTKAQMTLDYYAHVLEGQQADAAQRLGNLLYR